MVGRFSKVAVRCSRLYPTACEHRSRYPRGVAAGTRKGGMGPARRGGFPQTGGCRLCAERLRRIPLPAPEPAEAPEPLSAVDYAWLRMDDPTNLMIINGCLVLEQPLDRERLKLLLERRLLPIRRFRQRVVRRDRAPWWEVDPDFNLDAHVLETGLPASGDDAALRQVVSGLMSEPLDLARPLWRFHLIDGYKGGSVIMGRLHHCIGDGMALLLVLLSLTDRTADS